MWHILFRLTGGGGIIIFIFGALSFKVLDEMGKLFQGRIFSGPPPPAAPYFSLHQGKTYGTTSVLTQKMLLMKYAAPGFFSLVFFSL